MLCVPSARSKMFVIRHHKSCGPLEAGIRLPLLLIHRNRPAVRLGVYRFIVPVRTLHQANPHRSLAPLRPLDQLLQIRRRVLQVALNDDPHVADIAKFFFLQHFLENQQRQIFLFIRLHVDIDKGVVTLCDAEQFAQPFARSRECSCGIDRVELRVESRQLNRQVHPRHFAKYAAVDLLFQRPAIDFRGDAFDQAHVGLEESFGLRVTGDGFPQDVQRKASAFATFALRGIDDFVDIGSRNKTAGEIHCTQSR